MLFLARKLRNTNKTDLFSSWFYIFKSYEEVAVQTKMTLPCLIIISFYLFSVNKASASMAAASNICR